MLNSISVKRFCYNIIQYEYINIHVYFIIFQSSSVYYWNSKNTDEKSLNKMKLCKLIMNQKQNVFKINQFLN